MTSPTEETRAIARLPGLDIQVVHRTPQGESGEAIGILLHAMPSFEALSRTLWAVNPFLAWAQLSAELTQAAWSAWFGAFLPPPRRRRD